jgi:hypothetical protein
MVVHDIKMNQVSASGLNGANFFAQSGKVCGEDRRRNAERTGHGLTGLKQRV